MNHWLLLKGRIICKLPSFVRRGWGGRILRQAQDLYPTYLPLKRGG
jgi:hypothetical protein